MEIKHKPMVFTSHKAWKARLVYNNLLFTNPIQGYCFAKGQEGTKQHKAVLENYLKWIIAMKYALEWHLLAAL